MNHPISNKNPRRSPLAKSLIISIIIFSASITLVTTLIQLYNEYQRDIERIELQFNQIENIYLRSFTQSLWATNYRELQLQMEGLVKLPNIMYAAVHNGAELITEIGNMNSENTIKREYAMHYFFMEKQHSIGNLTVITTLDSIYEKLYREATTILIANTLRTLLVVFFIYYIFHRLIGRHISRISTHFKQLALDQNALLVLNRNKSNNTDELDQLVASVNEMQERINNTHSAFRESEKKYHTLTTVSPVGIFYTDIDGHCIYVNEKWSKITGMSAKAAEGEGWSEGIHPEDRDKVYAQWTQLSQKEIPFKLEYRFQHNDEERWVLGQAIAEKNNQGETIGYVGTITDISERNKAEKALDESEEKLRFINSHVPGIVYQFKIDNHGKKHLPYVSPAVENYIGLTAEAVMNNAEAWFSLTHPDDNPELNRTILESMTNLTTWKWEGRFIKENGEFIWLRGISTPKRMDDGSTIWNGLFLDVTERVHADETIKRGQKMDALGKLTGGIAHDYNNMLGVVLGYSDLLNESLVEQPKLKRYAKNIHHAAERGAKLTQKLLAFSKYKSTNEEKLNLNTLLMEQQHMLEKTLTVRIKLKFDLHENLWPVYLDGSELEDAILNMGINAMHAIKGNGHLHIKTRNLKINTKQSKLLDLPAGEYVQCCVSDSGVGMDKATSEKIFDPFFTTKGDNGTGLGLSQVYGFIKRCKGVIHVDSTLNSGSHFSLYFPRYQGEKQIEPVQSVIIEEKRIKGKETILIVDDEPELLNLTSEILAKHEYCVFQAENAKEALKILKTESIDLLISDIIMPEMGGYELASIVQDKYPNTKIQLASGYSGDHHLGKVNPELTSNLLQKPFTKQTILNKVQTLLL